MLSLIPIESSKDSSKFACLVAKRNKHKIKILIKTHCIKTLNEKINLNNKKIFYCTRVKKCIRIVLILCGFIANQPVKRHYANHTGENSEYGKVFRHSCNGG